MAALGLIAQHPRSSGYDLLKIFERSLANVWPATQSQLYGELNRLTEQGLITVSAAGPRGRKEYQVTDAGHTALRTWLIDEAAEPMRNPVMLKVFLLSELGRPGAAGYLDAMAEGTAEYLEDLLRLEESINWDASLDDRLGRVVLEWGKRMLRMQIEWAAWARDEVAKP